MSEQRPYQPASATNTNTVLGLHGALKYPFAPMNLGWLHEYVSNLGTPERLCAMCRILECLMANAVSTCDPFLEHAVVNFYTKFPAQSWSKVQAHAAGQLMLNNNNDGDDDDDNEAAAAAANSVAGSIDGMTFELSRQVFEVIGLIRRFPNATTKSRKMLLTLVERVLEDVIKVSLSSPSLHHNRSIPEIVSSVRECVVTLKDLHQTKFFTTATPKGDSAQPDSEKKDETVQNQEAVVKHDPAEEAKVHAQIDESLQHLSSWLKYLFFALSSTRPVLVPACPPPPPGVQVIVPCSESCPCFTSFKNKFPVYLSDVEKVKVIDSLLVSGHGATAEEEMYAFARELLQRYSIDFCTRAVAHVHNGPFALCRFYIFEALRLARRSQSIVSAAGLVEDARSLDLIEIALQRTQAACKGVGALSSIVNSVIPKSLASLTRVRNARSTVLNSQQQPDSTLPLQRQQAPTSPATAELYALQKHLTSIFQSLCNQQFLLCVHYIPHNNSNNNGQNVNSPSATVTTKKEGESDKNVTPTTKIPPPPSAASQPPPPPPKPFRPAVASTPNGGANGGPPQCNNPACTKPKGDLMKCSACKVAWYCGRDCQQADWKSHKIFCKNTAAASLQQQQLAEREAAEAKRNGPTAAAARWLNEKTEKPKTGQRIVVLQPMCI